MDQDFFNFIVPSNAVRKHAAVVGNFSLINESKSEVSRFPVNPVLDDLGVRVATSHKH